MRKSLSSVVSCGVFFAQLFLMLIIISHVSQASVMISEGSCDAGNSALPSQK